MLHNKEGVAAKFPGKNLHFDVYSWIIKKWLLKDYLRIIINDYRKIIEKIIEKGGGVGLKNGHLPLTDILPPEGDSGLGLPIFFGETIYTWTQFE